MSSSLQQLCGVMYIEVMKGKGLQWPSIWKSVQRHFGGIEEVSFHLYVYNRTYVWYN
jgi:hypothetical protein